MTDWPKIHLLEGRLRWHKGKADFRRAKLRYWQLQGQKAHVHHDSAGIAKARAEIIKWKVLLTPEELEIHRLESAIIALKPKQQQWLAGGWVRPGTPFRMQRQDQGQDFEIPFLHSVVAPGNGYCTGYSSDRPFPNGFGNPYATVHISDGRFGGHDWYLGHANEPIIRPGQHFTAGQPLARLNHSLNAGWGWIEIGHLPYGGMSEGSNWAHLFAPLWR